MINDPVIKLNDQACFSASQSGCEWPALQARRDGGESSVFMLGLSMRDTSYKMLQDYIHCT